MKSIDPTPCNHATRPHPADAHPVKTFPSLQLSSDEHLRAVLHVIPDLIWLKDAGGAYLSCNRAFERFIGATEAQIAGRTDHDFFEQFLANSFRNDDQATMLADSATTHEEWLTFAHGGYRGLFQTIKTPLRRADGTLVGIMGVARDITAQHVADARLLASELRYRRLFESAQDGILILDARTGMVVDVNPFLIERLGFSREHFLGRPIWELGPFKDIVGSMANFAELQQNEYIRYEDKPLVTADGRRFDVEFISNVYLVNRERVIQCNIRDITVRKATERRLSEQNEILSNSHEGVIVENLAHEVSLWNRGAEETFGWTSAEALGRPANQLLGIDDPSVVAMIRLAVRQVGFWNGELRAKSRTGGKLILDCRITLVRDKEGRPRAHLKFLADITEKKLLEEKFLRVQRLDAIGALASGISHDLNNILAPILISAGLLREKSLEAHDRELLELIEVSARRGAEVIKQLLTFSRGLEGDRVHVQVRHVVNEMVAIARETFPRNITVVAVTADDLWPIVADATHLHQVMMNLCVNARDAMPDGGKLTVLTSNVQLEKQDPRLEVHALAGAYVLLTVTDTGMGIPREVIDRIFEPFFTTKRIGQGTGLGLSTVLGIVRSHGGFIYAHSETGKGSAFHVYLPAAPTAIAKVNPDEAEDLDPGEGETILVVDDEPAIIAAMKACLERRGFRVVTASNGQEALALFASQRHELKIVLTDVMMPAMDGLTLARKLHVLDDAVRVIASSGLDPSQRPGLIEDGIIAEFLSKPYETSALLAAVSRQLKLARPSAP